MEELTEVVTATEFHPSHCNLFVYSSSKSTVKLCDMRQQALCDNHAKVFEEPEDPSSKSFFSEIISSIADVRFSRDGRYILARDYLQLKVWDVNMDKKPIRTISIHDHLRAKLCDLYENDCIFDKFECSFSGDGQYVDTHRRRLRAGRCAARSRNGLGAAVKRWLCAARLSGTCSRARTTTCSTSTTHRARTTTRWRHPRMVGGRGRHHV